MTQPALLSFDLAAPQLLTKANIESFANKFIEKVNEGFINPLETAAILSGLESAIKAIKEGIKETVLSELKEGGKGSFRGVKIETMEAAGRYSFSECGDQLWNELNAQAERLTEAKKERETFLKALPKSGIEILDESTGEVSKVYPPAKPGSATTYKITIPKS